MALCCGGQAVHTDYRRASQWLKSMLFDLTPTDPVTISSAVAALISATLLAAYLPARRAARVDPLVALRQE